jgi:4-hydroxybenzoate polyprenyltransferase
MGVMALLFIFSASQLNRLAFLLSPVALAIILGYSLTKRFTSSSHFLLGLSLAIAPVGAWIAINESVSLLPLLLGLAVLLWTAGFDIIYACQDVDFDRRAGLRSLPEHIGVGPALVVSAGLHAAMVGALVIVFSAARLGAPFLLGIVLVSVLLVYEHLIVKPDDLSRVNTAFFNINGAVSIVLMSLALVDILFV